MKPNSNIYKRTETRYLNQYHNSFVWQSYEGSNPCHYYKYHEKYRHYYDKLVSLHNLVFVIAYF
jgi:hypothetical protein